MTSVSGSARRLDPGPEKPSTRPRFRRMANLGWARRFFEQWILLILSVIVWQLVTQSAGSPYFPTPLTILGKLADQWLSRGLHGGFLSERWTTDLLPSLGRLAVGWALAIVFAIVLGLFLGLSRTLEQYVDPTLQFLRAIPTPAIIPLFLILLGTGTEMRIVLVTFGAIWPIMLNTVEGVRTVSKLNIDAATAFRIPWRAQVWRIILPAAAPKILAGLRVSLSIALILVILSEMTASEDGIGKRLILAQQSFAMTDLWVTMVVIALIGVCLNGALRAIEHHMLAWHRGSRGRSDRE